MQYCSVHVCANYALNTDVIPCNEGPRTKYFRIGKLRPIKNPFFFGSGSSSMNHFVRKTLNPSVTHNFFLNLSFYNYIYFNHFVLRLPLKSETNLKGKVYNRLMDSRTDIPLSTDSDSWLEYQHSSWLLFDRIIALID